MLKIEDALYSFSKGDLVDSSTNLFGAIGYDSEKRPAQLSCSPSEFLDIYNQEGKLNPDKALFDQWQSIDLLFQLTSDEINTGSQLMLDFGTEKKVNNTIIESYLFFTIELSAGYYTRTQLANITREINKVFPMPAMILFRHENTLTFSIINRRLHKRDESKDVLEKVTLIKDISFIAPHRAHIEILFDLSLDELYRQHGFTNFVELHQAWQKVLDSSELNKRFFSEIANWYFWATQHVTFPKDAGKDIEIRNATSVIRLITRLIFIWFIKEKQLVPDALFDQRKLIQILNYSDPNESTYYKAILQNLFFATLNQEMNTHDKPNNRKFRSRNKLVGGRDPHFNITNLYRYEDYFQNPSEVLDLFSRIPFLNGGLFECLDKTDKDDPSKILRIDGFSDRDDNELYVPDFLFFSEEREVDLNEEYGTKNKRYKVRGLIDILNSYKFTIEENTPIEEEIALDPELLGKVFENLLANYNPETKTTARQQTGSYYTRREIVNYMVDESLIAYLGTCLKEKVTSLVDMEELPELLREIFAYTEKIHPFNDEEVTALIDAIDNIKILDPACGSAAFPMGVLHKLVFILGKLDPQNELWKNTQLAKVGEITDITIRQKLIDDIEESFERNELDYGRKLYLIENCIYGVDIQPIAVQIAKLRFFISLIVDQKLDDSRQNRGILPLPNLETKFVAANNLLGLDRPQQLVLRNTTIDQKEKELENIRQRHFSARTQRTKQRCRDEDERLRAEIGALLKNDGFPRETTEKLTHWDPYDQNASANFFDPEWMFGITEGFDVVIANPPYVEFKNLEQNIKDSIRHYQTTRGKYDLYIPFLERNHSLLCDNGIATYICPTRFMHRDYGESIRSYIKDNFHILEIIDFGDLQIFDGVTNYTGIFIFTKEVSSEYSFDFVKFHSGLQISQDVFSETLQTGGFIAFPNSIKVGSQEITDKPWYFADSSNKTVINKIATGKVSLRQICEGIFQGISTGKDNVFIIDEEVMDRWDIEKSILYPMLKGKDIGRYLINWSKKYLIYPYDDTGRVIPEKQLHKYYPHAYAYLVAMKLELSGRDYFERSNKNWYELWNQRNLSRFKRTKIVTLDNAKHNSFVLDTSNFLGTTTVYSIILKNNTNYDYKFILGILNSSTLEYYHKHNTIPQAGGFYRYQATFIESLPIFDATMTQQAPIIKAVDKILIAKQADPGADTSVIESEIDRLVYDLYSLTEKEIKIVKDSIA